MTSTIQSGTSVLRECSSAEASTVTARRMRGERFRLELTQQDAVTLQDALDDYACDAGAGTKGWSPGRLRKLQRTLHALTGEEMPPTQAARRASLRRLVNVVMLERLRYGGAR